MAAQKRIYIVGTADNQPRLVRASGKAQAIGHVVRDTFAAVVPTQDELIKLVSSGVKVEETGDDNDQQQLAEAA